MRAPHFGGIIRTSEPWAFSTQRSPASGRLTATPGQVRFCFAKFLKNQG
jgi:hypothetical protein